MATGIQGCLSGNYVMQAKTASTTPTRPSTSVDQLFSQLQEKFPNTEIQVGNPSTQALFQLEGDNHVFIHPEFLQKAASSPHCSQQLEESIATLPLGKRMVEASASTIRSKVNSFGIIIHSDGSMGAWSVTSSSLIRKDQSERWEKFKQRSDRSIELMSRDERLKAALQKRQTTNSSSQVAEFPSRNLYAELKHPERWRASPETAYLPLLSKLSGDSFFDSQA